MSSVNWGLHIEKKLPEANLTRLKRVLQFQMYSRLLHADLCEDPEMYREVDFMNEEPRNELQGRQEASFEPQMRPMQPWIRRCGLEIWGPLHLVAILLSLVAIVLCILDLICLKVTCFVIASLLLLLSLGLALQGQLLVIARELRRNVKKYEEENDRLRDIVENLRQKVYNLRQSEKGLQNLEERFSGNVQKAQKMLRHETLG
eukprot:s1355_g25.t1